jgi:hypothetical protein
MEHPSVPLLQRGVLLRHSGGCLSPRVLDFLCFDTPRSVLGSQEEEDELTFYLADQDSLDEHVRQVRHRAGRQQPNLGLLAFDRQPPRPRCSVAHHLLAVALQGLLPCPALWVEHAALAAGCGHLRVLYRLGGALQHCELPFKPLKLQPSKQGAGAGAGSARLAAGGSGSRGAGVAPACRAYASSRLHLQLYRLSASLFPRLEQLDRDLCSGAVVLRGLQAGWAAPGLQADTATVVPQVGAGPPWCRPPAICCRTAQHPWTEMPPCPCID